MNRSLLIIDDSKAIRTQVEQIFADGRLFSKILTAADGIEAFKLLVSNKVDLVLCDIEMPGIDGLKFLAMMQSREDLKAIPIIMLTCHGDLSTKIRGLESGACDYITKPFEPAEIVARVHVQMQIKTLQDELRRSNQLLLQLAQTDPLTRLYNRRHLYEKLEVELNRCFRNKKPLSLIMTDIDHFKKVNDNYGHQIGDEVLTNVADLLQDELRTYDLAARYGGEEFCLVLPETDLESAYDVAERIRKLATEMKLPAPMENYQLTMSFGVAGYDGTDEGSIDEIIRVADDALYEAKNRGRNQVRDKEISN
ncbi:diguanylate cyclase [Malonomonas rubra]|uniref:diguanylate cyclase n=1 Tax=Malonomonas rubra TaxID=57040 RepID=UPI0026F1B287|nr:diguanylate cyclase [Malonomonas rubra]